MQKTISEVTIIEPVPIQPGQKRDFGQKRSYEIHPGEDLSAKPGTPVLALMDGEVVFTSPKVPLCGATIDIDYKNGYWSRYCHMSRIDVQKGDFVKQGQVVGLSGGVPGSWGAGNSKGPHLHISLKLNGTKVDPIEHINSVVPAGGVEPSPTSDTEVEDVQKVASELSKKTGVDLDELLKTMKPEEIRALFRKNIFAPFMEEVKRVKQLIK
jgi:murein DD-endopeptidase MepM/ murein hydrolase activator NlpD